MCQVNIFHCVMLPSKYHSKPNRNYHFPTIRINYKNYSLVFYTDDHLRNITFNIRFIYSCIYLLFIYWIQLCQVPLSFLGIHNVCLCVSVCVYIHIFSSSPNLQSNWSVQAALAKYIPLRIINACIWKLFYQVDLCKLVKELS